jgi:hypothetical protein
MQRPYFKRSQPLIGSVLITLGILIFSTNLDRTLVQLSRTFCTIPRQAMGVMPAIIMTASQVAQACAADHHRFLQILLLHPLASFWPLLLVMAGAVLSRDSFVD